MSDDYPTGVSGARHRHTKLLLRASEEVNKPDQLASSLPSYVEVAPCAFSFVSSTLALPSYVGVPLCVSSFVSSTCSGFIVN